MAIGRSLQGIFTNVFKSNVNTVNQNAYPECQFVRAPDGSLVEATPAACAARIAKEDAANKSWLNSETVTGIASAVAGFVPVIGTASSIAIKAANTIQQVQSSQPLLSFKPTSLVGGGVKPMGLFDDIWGAATGPGGIFNANNGVNWSNLVNTGVNFAQQAFAPQPSASPMPSMGGGTALPVMASVPAIATRVGAVVGRSFFTRFPNLATSIQGLRNAGQNVTRAKLYGVMKRFGPEFLVSGGLLTAAAVNELAVAGPGRRRMNPANSKALRRAARRIESFHRLCQATDKLRSRRRR